MTVEKRGTTGEAYRGGGIPERAEYENRILVGPMPPLEVITAPRSPVV